MGLFGGHNTTIRENKISSFTVSTAEYGSTVPEILGTTRISPNVIYYDDFTAHEHRSSQKSGKGGGSRTTTINYTYTVAVILALCEGQISGIGKMWKDKSLYQYPNGDIGLTLSMGKQIRSRGRTRQGSIRTRRSLIAGLLTWPVLLTSGITAPCRPTISR